MLLKRNYNNSPVRSVTIESVGGNRYSMAITTIGGNLINGTFKSFNPDHLDMIVITIWECWHDRQWASFEL